MSRSAPNTPDNNLTPNAITLPSSTGFNVGDLVYYKDGDYKALPANALSAATFNVTQSTPTYQQPIGSNVATRVSVGGSKGESSAVLTSGNIVTVYINQNSQRPTFFITTPAGGTVVAATEISTVYTSTRAGIGVAALSGGGFVVYWINQIGGTLNVPTYAIYNNSGVVVTAVNQDGGAGAANSTGGYLAGVALPDGGFALSYIVATGTVVSLRGYNSVGAANYAWTTVGSVVVNASQRINMAARSDSSFMVLYQQDTINFKYTVYSSAGAALNTNTFAGTVAASAYGGAPATATVLSDGTTFVIGYGVYDGGTSTVGSYYRYCFRLLPSSYVLSAETVIPPSNTSPVVISTAAGYVLSVKSLAAGGFIFVFADPSGALYYAFFNNSGAPISGSNLNGALVFPIPGSYAAYQYKHLTILEYGGNMNLFWGIGIYNASNPFIQTAAISTSTYQLVNYQSLTDNLGTVSSSVSGLANTTTPGAARFLASASSTQVLNNSMGFTINPTTITSVACNGIQIASRADGGFVIVYQSSSTTLPVTAVVYNRFGAVVQTIAVGNGGGGSTARTVGVTILDDNTLIIAFPTAANNLSFYAYTLSGGTYSLAATTSIGGVRNNFAADYRFSIAAINNTRFVVAYPDTVNQATFVVLSNSLTTLAGPTNIQAVASTYITAAAFVGGGFAVFYRGGTTYRNVYYVETSANAFSQINNANMGAVVTGETTNMVVTPGNAVISTVGITSGTALNVYSKNPMAIATGELNFSGLSNYEIATCVGITGAGSVVLFFGNGFTATSGRAIAFNSGLYGASVATNTPTSGAQVLDFNPISAAATGAVPAQICTAPGVGYNCIFAWLDVNNYPTYAMLYAYPSTYAASITSGVTASALQPITPYSNQPLSGYVLQGVALTSAPAGGTGQVQTKGTAKLNSNYSASTPASSFDFQTPNGTSIPGVKGTAIGNTVILEGRA